MQNLLVCPRFSREGSIHELFSCKDANIAAQVHWSHVRAKYIPRLAWRASRPTQLVYQNLSNAPVQQLVSKPCPWSPPSSTCNSNYNFSIPVCNRVLYFQKYMQIFRSAARYQSIYLVGRRTPPKVDVVTACLLLSLTESERSARSGFLRKHDLTFGRINTL